MALCFLLLYSFDKVIPANHIYWLQYIICIYWKLFQHNFTIKKATVSINGNISVTKRDLDYFLGSSELLLGNHQSNNTLPCKIFTSSFITMSIMVKGSGIIQGEITCVVLRIRNVINC